MEFSMNLIEPETRGQDWQRSLRLVIDRLSQPRWLADFDGGHGSFFDGYSTREDVFRIEANNFAGSLDLNFGAHRWTLHPSTERIVPMVDPLNQLTVLPLRFGQRLPASLSAYEQSEFEISNSSGWLK